MSKRAVLFPPAWVVVLALVAALPLHAICAEIKVLKPSSAASSGKIPDQKLADRAAEFFADPTVRVFDITVAAAQLEQLTKSGVYVSGRITDGEQTVDNVGLRLKGMSSFRRVDEKPSLAVKFDEFVKNQSFRGLKKVMFNNSVQDTTYLAELLGTQLFTDAGVPAARVTHARVRLNGRDLGLYVVIEAMNKDFLKRHFGSAEGNLYEGFMRDVNRGLEQDNGDDTTKEDLRILNETCAITDPSERWTRLNEVLDIPSFLSFIGMELLTGHWDGYAIHANNYRIYHDPRTAKIVFITHGLDGVFRRPNLSIEPPLKSLVAGAVLSTAQGQKLYHERIRELFVTVFKPQVILDRMDQALSKFRQAGLSAAATAQIEQRAAVMRERIETRAVRVDEQLRGILPQPLKFDKEGFGYPSSWREEPDRGEATVDRVTYLKKNTLHILARDEQTKASWRAQLCLTPGWYRFEGMACSNLSSGGYAGLRTSGESCSVIVAGASKWQPLTHVFQVPEGSPDTELICELSANRHGDVWFELNSLRLKRIAAPAPQAFGRVLQ